MEYESLFDIKDNTKNLSEIWYDILESKKQKYSQCIRIHVTTENAEMHIYIHADRQTGVGIDRRMYWQTGW